LHEQVLAFRDVAYAHTDKTPLRQVAEFSTPEGFARWLRSPDDFGVAFAFPTPQLFEELIALAKENLTSLISEWDLVHTRIVAGVSVLASEHGR
jgi:hypothetical protein